VEDLCVTIGHRQHEHVVMPYVRATPAATDHKVVTHRAQFRSARLRVTQRACHVAHPAAPDSLAPPRRAELLLTAREHEDYEVEADVRRAAAKRTAMQALRRWGFWRGRFILGCLTIVLTVS